MNPTLRNILVVIGALVAGSIIVYAFESISHIIFAPPAEIDTADIASLKTFMKNAPAGSLAIVLLAHAAGAMVSGWLIGRFVLSSQRMLAMIVGLVWTFFGVINLVLIPHPLWFTIADVCVYFPMTLLGLKLSGSNS